MGSRRMQHSALQPALTHLSNPLTKKLLNFVPLSASDCAVLDGFALRQEYFDADMDIVSEGASPRSVFVLLEGLAIRYRNLPDGSRQIMTLLIPGDLSNMHVFPGTSMDHSIGTITPVRVGCVAREDIMEILVSHPRISTAFCLSSMQEEAMLRERIVSLGRRDARGRIAYLLCELLWRKAALGLASGDAFQLPLTQTELGDTLGLTPVHVNRILRDLREQGLIAMAHRTISLLDVEGLKALAGFDSDYLNLGGASADLVRYFDDLEPSRPVH